MEVFQKIMWISTTIFLSVVYHARSQMSYGDISDMMFDSMMDPSAPQPVLDETPVTLKVHMGNNVTLPCHVRNKGDTQTTWLTADYTTLTSDKNIIANNPRLHLISNDPDDYALTIVDVQPEDGIIYQCMVQAFPPQIKQVTLQVYSKPKIQKSELKERYIIKEGSTMDIVCPVSGFPEPKVTWYVYTDNPISLEEEKEEVSSNARLKLYKIKRAHAGIYRCEAKNEYGEDMYEVFIQAAYAPVLRTNQSVVTVQEGSQVTLHCEVESVPKPDVKWQSHKGEFIETDWKHRIHMYADNENTIVTELDIFVEMSDSGKYICSASNEHGQSHSAISLMVLAKPSKIDMFTTTTTKPVTTRSFTTKKQEPPATEPEELQKSTSTVASGTPRTEPSRDNGASTAQQTISLVLFVFFAIILLVL